MLAARHDEFAAALERLEGRAEFQVTGRYIKNAVLNEIVPQNKQAERLRDAIEGKDPNTARNAKAELDQLMNDTVRAWREQDTQALQPMDGVCVASAAQQSAGELDAVHVAFLVDLGNEREAERVIETLARRWEGRIGRQLLGPMAAYDFTGTA